MVIAWDSFTPGAAVAGGLLIGAASALYILGNGRVAGIAGIVAGPLAALASLAGAGRPTAGRLIALQSVRLYFLAGLLAAPWLWRAFAPLPAVQVDVGPGAVVLAGLLVGVGVRMGNGCTSGHGICGLSRLQPRSAANVAAFMATGFASVWLLRHLA